MERPKADLEQLGAAVQAALASEGHASAEIRLARAGLLERVAQRNFAGGRASGFAGRVRIAVFAGAAAAAALGLWAWTRTPVTFQVGVGVAHGRPGDLLQATSATPTPVRFSEGSSLDIHQGGRVRILATEPRGARVLVEEGTIDVSIAPARIGKKQWTFEAGSFSVQVTGTKFKLSYRALDQSFGLVMDEGRVVVSAPCLKAPTPVAAGAKVELSCAPKPEPTKVADAGPPPAERPTETAAAAERPSRENKVWRELLGAGRLQDGLAAAERANFPRVCQTATARELLALADAGRLFGRSARAVQALRVLRERFPSSAEASTAAFALGRIAFEQQHAYNESAKWFATYLREQPSGPLMGDSVGRLMEARLRAGDQAGARMDAEQYLRRFPEGPYASEARGILSK